MGFQVQAVVTFKKSPNEHAVDLLDHQFGTVHHDRGSTTVTITEHVSMNDVGDAVAFVRSLVLDAIPQGAVLASIDATAD
jgi:hypothetical protein